MAIDVRKLRNDMKNESYAAFFGGGFGGALVESFDIDRMSDEELVRFAMVNNVDLGKYSDEDFEL